MRISVVALAIACFCLPTSGRSDPVPVEELWCGGRLVPAKAVPVDMASESLRAEIRPVPVRYHGRTDGIGAIYTAEVTVEYEFTSDRQLNVPVVFPIVGGAQDVGFVLGGQALPVRLVRDIEVFAAYERDWERIIDRAVQPDARLRAVAERAQRERAELLRRYPPDKVVGGADAAWDAYLHSTGVELERLAGSLKLGDGTGLLVTYLLDDWKGTYGNYEERLPGLTRWMELWAKRTLAVTFDPRAPDPTALWESVPVTWMGLRYYTLDAPYMTFAMAELPLKQGTNRLLVSFRQPLSIENRSDRATGKYAGQSHRFEFILRTARFWRSFGRLEAEVLLPRGARMVETRPPEARIGGFLPKRIRLAAEGLPAENLSVEFADFAWQAEKVSLVDTLGVPPPGMAAVLARPPTGSWPPAKDSAYRHFLRNEPAQLPWDVIHRTAWAAVVVLVAATVWWFRRRRKGRRDE
ncbi:MAG: hypothetical protein FJX75_28775 [Armatimonadetes bacterium]|nr:hypothetical protein [Armatimonadota bacterium]